MSRNWRWFIPGYILAMPQTLLLGLPFLFWYLPKKFSVIDGTLCFVSSRKHLVGGPWVGAQTHGLFKIFRDEAQMDSDSLHVHENVHVVQAMQWGPFYALSYGLHFVWLYLWPRLSRKPTVPTINEAYRNIMWEKRAYGIQEKFDRGELESAWGK